MRFPSRLLLLDCFVIGIFYNVFVSAFSLPDQEAFPSLQNLSLPSNISTDVIKNLKITHKYLIFPLNPNKVSEIQNIIYENVHSGRITRIESHLRPQFDGVEYWIVGATPAEILQIKSLVGNDVSNLGKSLSLNMLDVFFGWAMDTVADRK